jgi:hypothetical protein
VSHLAKKNHPLSVPLRALLPAAPANRTQLCSTARLRSTGLRRLPSSVHRVRGIVSEETSRIADVVAPAALLLLLPPHPQPPPRAPSPRARARSAAPRPPAPPPPSRKARTARLRPQEARTARLRPQEARTAKLRPQEARAARLRPQEARAARLRPQEARAARLRPQFLPLLPPPATTRSARRPR